MSDCIYLVGDLQSERPVRFDRKIPDSIIPIRHDLSAVLDCEGAGVTIISSTWAIDPDDDDGSVTLSQTSIDGLVTRAMMAGGTDAKSYLIVNTVTASDGGVVYPTVQVFVRATRKLTA